MTRKPTAEMMMASALRFERAIALLSDPTYTFKPFESSANGFFVMKQSGETYIVLMETRDCNCADHTKTRQDCKHILACDELLREEAQCAAYDENVESGRDEYCPL